MYATLGHALPRGGGWTYEPKYDGMRVLAEVSARHARLVTRNGKEKQDQFPEIVEVLRSFVARVGRGVVLDGEIVARRRRSRAGTSAASEFQPLQARMHLKDAGEIARLSVEAPATLVAFDVLREGRATLTARPWTERRARLESLFSGAAIDDPALRLTDTSSRGTTMLARARRAGWEGIIAKRKDAPYRPGARSDDWLKLKLQYRAEFVVGGFTEPRNSRPFLGALLLGAHGASGQLLYVGHMGGGFDREGLRAMRARLENRAAHLTVRGRATYERAGPLGGSEARGRSQVRGVDRRRTAAPADLPRHPGRQARARRHARRNEHAALERRGGLA